jgi:hypothetical protein
MDKAGWALIKSPWNRVMCHSELLMIYIAFSIALPVTACSEAPPWRARS